MGIKTEELNSFNNRLKHQGHIKRWVCTKYAPKHACPVFTQKLKWECACPPVNFRPCVRTVSSGWSTALQDGKSSLVQEYMTLIHNKKQVAKYNNTTNNNNFPLARRAKIDVFYLCVLKDAHF